jgi:hypothetical protein
MVTAEHLLCVTHVARTRIHTQRKVQLVLSTRALWKMKALEDALILIDIDGFAHLYGMGLG